MYKKILFSVLTLSLSVALVSSVAYGQSITTTTTTQSKARAIHHKKAVTTISDTTVTTTPAEPRQVLSQDMLKKNSSSICAPGFQAYVGNDKKNVCQNKATAPDIAYSCVWAQKGTEAYKPSAKGPCTLDFAEQLDKVVMTKSDYKSSPPLKYGVEAQCCFRAAKGAPTTTSDTTMRTK